VGECFFWYRPTLVVLDQGPLNGCVCVYGGRETQVDDTLGHALMPHCILGRESDADSVCQYCSNSC